MSPSEICQAVYVQEVKPLFKGLPGRLAAKLARAYVDFKCDAGAGRSRAILEKDYLTLKKIIKEAKNHEGIAGEKG